MGIVMKNLSWILISVLAVLAVIGWLRPRAKGEAMYVRDTLVVRDTVRDSVPKPVLVRFDHWDTLPVYIRDIDTLRLRDSIYIPVPIERKEYRTDDYHAVISGWHPRLESIEVYRQTRTITVTPKKKRWGIGPTIGVGVPGGWYVGIGVSYDLWQW